MSPNKEKAIAALLTSKTKLEAARIAGVSESMIYKYFKDPEFKKRYQEALADIVRDATKQAQQFLSPALQTLKDVMDDEESPVFARISAARTILECALKLKKQNDFAERAASEAEQWFWEP